MLRVRRGQRREKGGKNEENIKHKTLSCIP